MLAPLVAPYIETLAPYIPGKPIEEVTREYGVADPVKLASNENPLGPSPLAQAAIQAGLGKLHLYPDGSAFALKRGLSRFLGVPVSDLALGNGTNELVTLLARTFLSEGEEAVFPAATFIAYRIAVQSCGRRFTEVPMREHRADLAAMAQALTARTRLVFLSNPDNPHGTHVSEAALRGFLARVPERCLVVLDEAYFEFVDAPDYPNGLALRAEFPNLVVLRTHLLQIYGLAGLRVGYGIARPRWSPTSTGSARPSTSMPWPRSARSRPSTIRPTSGRRSPWSRAGRALLDPRAAPLRLPGGPPRWPTSSWSSSTGSGQSLFEALLPHGCIVRPLAGYGMPHAVRISIGTPAENQRLLNALETVSAAGQR